MSRHYDLPLPPALPVPLPSPPGAVVAGLAVVVAGLGVVPLLRGVVVAGLGAVGVGLVVDVGMVVAATLVDAPPLSPWALWRSLPVLVAPEASPGAELRDVGAGPAVVGGTVG